MNVDGDDAEPMLVERRMGPGVRRLLARHAADWTATCPHPDRPQLGSVAETASMCGACAVGSAAVERWATGSGCNLCGRATDRVDRLWFIEPTPGVVVAVRLCDPCQQAETSAVDEKENPMSHPKPCDACLERTVTAGYALEPVTGGVHVDCWRELNKMSRQRVTTRGDRIVALRVRHALNRGLR